MNSLKLSYFNQVPKQKFKSSMTNDCQVLLLKVLLLKVLLF